MKGKMKMNIKGERRVVRWLGGKDIRHSSDSEDKEC